jgi:glutathione S-transferase
MRPEAEGSRLEEDAMIRLHDSLISGNGYKIRLLLTQLGIPFERVEYDLAKRETRTPVHRPPSGQ